MPRFGGTVVNLSRRERKALLQGERGAPLPIDLDRLALLRLGHYDFTGTVQRGELVVYRALADEVLGIFERLFRARFPIERMVPLGRLGRCDLRSMASNNTYGYGLRAIAGSRRLSWHSFGLAIDVNPRLNPVIEGDSILPEDGLPYRDRSRERPGMIVPGSLVHRAFVEAGWEWGGSWTTLKDYHHFQKPLPELEALRIGK